MGTQVIVIATRLIADLSERDWVRYLWHICGVAAFLVVLWGIWSPLRVKTRLQSGKLARFFDRLVTYFTVLWIGYPIVWILGRLAGVFLIKRSTHSCFACCQFSRRSGLAFWI